MSSALFVLWIALIGADRIDLAGGHGPFILTPFLALTPVVAVAELVRRYRDHRPIVLTRGAVAYAVAAGALVVVVLFSVYGARDTAVSASRAALLLADIAGTFAIALCCADRDDLLRLMSRGALLSLCLFVAFDIAQVLWVFGRMAEVIRIGPSTLKIGDLQSAGPIPRLAGPVADGNRAAFLLLFYILVIADGERHRLLRGLGLALAAALFVATLSRSGSLGALGFAVMWLLDRRPRIAPAAILGTLVVASGLVALLVLRPALLDAAAAVAESPAATARLTLSEGSAASHVELIGRGIAEGTSSVQRAFTGIGYGNAYLELQDMFPGSKYGNYHSLFVTMFAESGVFALLFALLLVGRALARGTMWRPLVAGAVLFNLFYQTTTEPAFWLALAFAWMTVTGSSARAASPWSFRHS